MSSKNTSSLLSVLLGVLAYCNTAAQSKRVYSNNELNFQYGFSLKALVECSFLKKSQPPVFRLCADFGLGSNILARSLYFSINTELQLYNGGLGSRRRPESTKPYFTIDIINAFTLTAGLNNYFAKDSLPVIQQINRNQPLYYFANFTNPALQNPYDYSLSLGTNLIFTTDKLKTRQRLGFINVHVKSLQLCYFNDGGTPIDEMYLGDRRDRFYTGGALIAFHGKSRADINQAELSFFKFTGYTKDAFEASNRLDLAFVNYKNTEEKYYNKSVWTLNLSNTEKGFGININRYNYTNWDIQHLIHFSTFNSYHLVPYKSYFSAGVAYFFNHANIGLQ